MEKNADIFYDWPQSRSITGKSLLKALILASTNPQYDKRLFQCIPIVTALSYLSIL